MFPYRNEMQGDRQLQNLIYDPRGIIVDDFFVFPALYTLDPMTTTIAPKLRVVSSA